MHIPKAFEETDLAVLHGLIRAHPLATLVTQAAGGLVANHLPLVLAPDPAPFGTLHGHVARPNPLWREYDASVEALVVFQGAEHFITPSWYATKQESGKVVPTWNYVVVHARGPLLVRDDPAWIRPHLEQLTAAHEGRRAAPWTMEDAPADYIDSLVTGVVGIELPIRQLHGKWKVSQNRPARDREGVIAGLGQEGTEAAARMAHLVRDRGTGP